MEPIKRDKPERFSNMPVERGRRLVRDDFRMRLVAAKDGREHALLLSLTGHWMPPRDGHATVADAGTGVNDRH